MHLNPVHITVAHLMAGRLFRIPDYQRGYAWGSRQRKDLFEDIEGVDRSKRDHFMATVVALRTGVRIIGADEYKTVELVDGQQRVTTLVILMKAIQKFLAEAGVEEDYLLKLNREIKELLVKGDDYSLILLQTNHDDSEIFTNYIRTGQIDKGKVRSAADENIVNAAIECESFVRDWVGRVGTIVDLTGIIRNKLSVVYHEIIDEATVYRVFEVLNSRGLDVKWIDKLKSQLMALIFEHLEGGNRAEAASEMRSIWQNIYRTLGREVEIGDEALRFAGSWVFETRPKRIIKQEEAAATLANYAGNEVKTIAACGKHLKEVVEIIQQLNQNVRLRAVTRISHARFVAAAILLRRFKKSTSLELLSSWEKATFRIFGLGGADTRNKVGDYVRLGYDIIREGMDPETIKERLKSIGSDYDIRALVGSDGFWSNCYEGWTEKLRYILYRYDEHLSSEAGEKLNMSQWNKIWSEDPSRSIEHIFPQHTGIELIHHLGNLTMLPPGLNSSLGGSLPAEKAKSYQECGLKATVLVGREITQKGQWSEADILTRAKAIEEFVLREWAD